MNVQPFGSPAAPGNSSYAQQFDYVSGSNVIYEAWAAPGTATSLASWAIAMYTYSGSNLVAIQWADGNNAMDNVWDNRASLSYS